MIQERKEEMDKLSAYLGLVETPGVDLANDVDGRAEGPCLWLTDKSSFHRNVSKGLPSSFGCAENLHLANQHWLVISSNTLKTITMIVHIFFFKDRNAGKSTVAELLCSLAWQMASSNGKERHKLQEMCSSGVKIDKKDARSIWRTMFASRISTSAILGYRCH